MKRLFRIFELSKSEQRVVLILMFVLIVFAFVGYERRVHRVHARTPTVLEMQTSPSPEQTEEEH
ncbi:MAG: hypothetical protein DME95_01460 [Verrucomicrobia bacterium]|nr:MAG: hypothetical protein DME95_01460 [Verrucomicrobiota bacterium]